MSTEDEIFGYLARLLGRDAAEDAFRRRFCALFGPTASSSTAGTCVPGSSRSRHASPSTRRGKPAPTGSRRRSATDDAPAYAELSHLAGRLPPTERAAVVLRYGYDLAYDDIGAALGSNEEAAAPAASSGVRRLRKERRPHDQRSPDSTAASATRRLGRAPGRRLRLRGVAGRPSSSSASGARASAGSRSTRSPTGARRLARRSGPRPPLRAPGRPGRRELDEYFEGGRQEFDLPVDLTPLPDFQRAVLEELGACRTATSTRTAGSQRDRQAAGRAGSRRRAEPEPGPDRRPVPPNRRRERQPRRLRRRARAQAGAARARGRLVWTTEPPSGAPRPTTRLLG